MLLDVYLITCDWGSIIRWLCPINYYFIPWIYCINLRGFWFKSTKKRKFIWVCTVCTRVSRLHLKLISLSWSQRYRIIESIRRNSLNLEVTIIVCDANTVVEDISTTIIFGCPRQSNSSWSALWILFYQIRRGSWITNNNCTISNIRFHRTPFNISRYKLGVNARSPW